MPNKRKKKNKNKLQRSKISGQKGEARKEEKMRRVERRGAVCDQRERGMNE